MNKRKSAEHAKMLRKAIAQIGQSKLAREAGVIPPAIQGIVRRGLLPKTEWLPSWYKGATNYAALIEKLTNGEVTRDQLLMKDDT